MPQGRDLVSSSDRLKYGWLQRFTSVGASVTASSSSDCVRPTAAQRAVTARLPGAGMYGDRRGDCSFIGIGRKREVTYPGSKGWVHGHWLEDFAG